jgi:hypothetical protein
MEQTIIDCLQLMTLFTCPKLINSMIKKFCCIFFNPWTMDYHQNLNGKDVNRKTGLVELYKQSTTSFQFFKLLIFALGMQHKCNKHLKRKKM